jgi:hypothetical protein
VNQKACETLVITSRPIRETPPAVVQGLSNRSLTEAEPKGIRRIG